MTRPEPLKARTSEARKLTRLIKKCPPEAAVIKRSWRPGVIPM